MTDSLRVGRLAPRDDIPSAHEILDGTAEVILPVDLATEAQAILGQRGRGKTNTAVVIAEEMIEAGVPVVVVDTVGVWWGLRSSADGQHEGLPVVVFGGEHADVPLEEGAGKIVARVILDQRFSCVVDTSGLPSKAAARRFLLDFVTALYLGAAKDRRPLHVIFDEADELAPQRTGIEGAKLLGAMEDFVRRGRSRGLGVTLVTQRPAVLNKDVLTQVEVLWALGMTGPRDVAAIDEWTRANATDDQAKTVKQTLASLPRGTAWLWSPQFLDLFERVEVRKRRTFDSSATPEFGKVRVEPTRRAEIDLAALGAEIAATVERAKADDPRALRARIAELERDLNWERTMKPVAEPERIEVRVLTKDDIAVLDGVGESISRFLSPLGELRAKVSDDLLAVEEVLLGLGERFGIEVGGQLTAPEKVGEPIVAPVSVPSDVPLREGRGTRTAASAPTPPVTVSKVDVSRSTVSLVSDPLPGHEVTVAKPLSKAERAVLAALVQFGPMSSHRLALLSGYSIKSSSFSNALGSLRSAGRINREQPISATEQGVADLGPYDALPTGEALIGYWMERLGKAERAVLDCLLDAWPATRTNEEVSEATGYSLSSSSFSNALGRLRSLTLISGGRDANLADDTLGQARHG